MQEIEEITKQAESDCLNASDLKALDAVRVRYLGKKGFLTEALKSLGKLPPSERPEAGQKINAAKVTVQALLAKYDVELKKRQVESQLASEKIDVTLPGRGDEVASLHPVNQTFDRLREIFSSMGFSFMQGPEIEDDYHNFAALNIPELHPARAMQDTFYFANDMLLRTHMSPVQIRAMKEMPPPLRMVAMGRVYRRDFDLTHTPMFHQMECLMIDENISFADLKGLLKEFLQAFFEADIGMRFRPSYFPFTEPSAEVDMTCLNCKGKGCRICKQTGWLEILGCGMVHPNVLAAVNIDTNKFQGLAFGVGVDRLAMLKYGITDLRSLFENDVRFLKQF